MSEITKLMMDKQETLKRELAEADKLYREKELERQKQKQQELLDKEEQEKRDREFREQQNFWYETPKQKSIRYRLMEIGDTVNNLNSNRSYIENREERIEVLLKEYRQLQEEYISQPYVIGTETFRQVPCYEDKNGTQRIEFKNGKWILYDLDGLGNKTPSSKTIKVEDGTPKQILGMFTTSYMQRYFNGLGMPTIINLDLIDANDKFPEKKSNTVPYRPTIGWYCDICKAPNSDDKATKCNSCGATRIELRLFKQNK